MTSQTELTRYIRYQLADLGAQNKNHDFEHLCRQFARLRICANILVATGPVGAGGDQGRDFETFRTYLRTTTPSTFLGDAGKEPIVFGCTLQKKSLKTKIKGDVKTICEGGSKLSAIYYFCESNLPVAQRHELSDWAKENHQVHLEIIDGATLSEQLSSVDLFWIAQEFLGISADIYPRPAESEEWYSKAKTRWLTGEQSITNSEEFFEVKSAIRRSTFSDLEKPDLPLWISKMEMVIDSPELPYLRQRATYEVCVAALRGLNNLTTKAALVQSYFAGLRDLTSTAELKDATVLLSYCSTAIIAEQFTFEVALLHEWSAVLKEKIGGEIAVAMNSTQRANLYQIRGHVATLPFVAGTTANADFSQALSWWNMALDEAEDSPLFPLESFSSLLCQLAGYFPDDNAVIELSSRADDLLAKRVGQYSAAENARELANAFLKADKYLAAIKQLHRSKEKWFAAETLKGSLISMLILANAYRALGLHYASKHYAYSAGFLALKADDETLRRFSAAAAFELCMSAFYAGEWLNLFHFASVAVMTSGHFKQDELQSESEKLQRLYLQLAGALAFARRFSSGTLAACKELLGSALLPNGDDEIVLQLSESNEVSMAHLSDEEMWEALQENLGARPFVDIGVSRTIEWMASGIKWQIHCKNNGASVAIAEQVAAALQVLLADFASVDLCLYPTSASIEIELYSGGKVQVEDVPDNDRAKWKFSVPEGWVNDISLLERVDEDVFPLAIAILSKCSALKWDAFKEVLDKSFENGLGNKVRNVRPYADLFRNFLSSAYFEDQGGNILQPIMPDRAFRLPECAELAWRDGLGPTYDPSAAKRDIENRYVKALCPMRLTLARWKGSQELVEFTQHLRAYGFKDWLILLILSNAVLNFRMNLRHQQGAKLDELKEYSEKSMNREERIDDPEVPISILAIAEIESQIQMTLAAVAKTFGLDLNQTTPDFAAMRRLLEVRYRILEDDIEHQDPFA